jgi:uncharacterized protein YciI
MRHYLLFYDVVADYAERRIPLRPAHLAYAQRSVDAGTLVLGGALTDPVDQAVLLFRADSRATVERFAESDPYVLNGIVRSGASANGRPSSAKTPRTSFLSKNRARRSRRRPPRAIGSPRREST